MPRFTLLGKWIFYNLCKYFINNHLILYTSCRYVGNNYELARPPFQAAGAGISALPRWLKC